MKTNIIIKGICILGITMGSFSLTFSQQLPEDDIKINIAQITNSTEKLKNLNPVTFNYNRNKFKALDLPGGNRYGFLAREVENVFPDMLQPSSKVYTTGKNTTKTAKYDDVDHETLIPVLVAAVKEQQEQIELLKKEIEQLKSK